jgi:hypothetical protein
MDSLEPTAPAGRHMPAVVAVILAVLLALGVAFAWPW